ncbi:MAG: PQQ-binding-like beta-propeller repeat protein, partial [Planctomycetota bacterium]|nr:PQQ-binding-like beta-propeller repeat protein [Planctomycetota bacterium]
TTMRSRPYPTAPVAALLMAMVTFTTFFSACSTAADSGFWPRFHGPKGDNISTETGLLKKWPQDGPELLWTAKGIGKGFSGVTIVDGFIYTNGEIGEKNVITALDMDGNIRWQVENGGAWTGSYPGSRGTPVIDGDRLYHESPLGGLLCLNAKTGKEIWGTNILGHFGSKTAAWACAESPLVDGDHLIVCPGGPETAVVALDKMTGKTVWKSPSVEGKLVGYVSPAIIEQDGLRILLTMMHMSLVGVNADTGDVLFSYESPTKYPTSATTPIYHDGKIFISTGYGTTGSTLLKLDVDGKQAKVTKVWNSRELDNHHGGVILYKGHLYGAAHKFNRSKWICLDWDTGEMKYAEKGVGKGSSTMAEGMLYTLSEKKKAGLVKAAPDGHELVGEFKLPKGGKGPSWAHPVVCGGRLYIRHGDFLYAYDVRER